MILHRRALLSTLAGLSLAGLRPMPLAAQPPLRAPGPQATTEGAQVRLIAGPQRAGMVEAGLEIRLDHGWKTYWRYPGDSGVPPRFDWSRSINVADVTVGWPAPRKFADGSGGFSIGYKDTVVLPLAVRLAHPDAAAVLDLDLDFAVCQALCVPAQAHLAVPLPSAAGESDPRLDAAQASVPQVTPLGASGTPSVLALALDATQTPPRLTITARASPAALLFLEGPDERWALPLPDMAGAQGDVLRFTAPLLGVPAETAVAGARLRLTLVDGDRAIETEATAPATGTGP